MKNLLLVSYFLVTGCTSNIDEFADFFELSASEDTRKQVAAETKFNMGAYQYQGRHQVESISCIRDKGRDFVMVTNMHTLPFDKSFCQGWIAQTVLSKNYNVVGVNLPGHGKSSGKVDFGGLQSLAALKKVTDAVDSMVGVWGFGVSSIAVNIFSKSLKLQWIVVGNGVFDTEEYVNAIGDEKLRRSFRSVLAAEPDGNELRSISWDFEGYPKRVYIYSGGTIARSGLDQAKSFRDALSASEYKVDFRVLPNLGERFPKKDHKKIFDAILQDISNSRKSS